MRAREVRPGLVHAVAGGAWVTDVAMPVVAFVSGADLSARFAGDWFAELAASGRPAPCAAIAGYDAVCWVAPEGCNAVYRFSAGSSERFALPAPALTLAAGGGACWALLDANADEGGLVARVTARSRSLLSWCSTAWSPLLAAFSPLDTGPGAVLVPMRARWWFAWMTAGMSSRSRRSWEQVRARACTPEPAARGWKPAARRISGLLMTTGLSLWSGPRRGGS